MTYNIFRVKMAEKVPSPLKYSIPNSVMKRKSIWELYEQQRPASLRNLTDQSPR